MWNPWIEAVLGYGAVEVEDGGIVNAWRKWACDAYMDTYFALRFEDYWRRVRCPALMLPDENDASDEAHRDIIERLSQLPERCEIVVVPGSVHALGWMLIPERMAGAVADFVRKVDA